jgi:hypothetical protein
MVLAMVGLDISILTATFHDWGLYAFMNGLI